MQPPAGNRRGFFFSEVSSQRVLVQHCNTAPLRPLVHRLEGSYRLSASRERQSQPDSAFVSWAIGRQHRAARVKPTVALLVGLAIAVVAATTSHAADGPAKAQPVE